MCKAVFSVVVVLTVQSLGTWPEPIRAGLESPAGSDPCGYSCSGGTFPHLELQDLLSSGPAPALLQLLLGVSLP